MKTQTKLEDASMNMLELYESLEEIKILADLAEYCVYREETLRSMKFGKKYQELEEFLASEDSVIDIKKIKKLLSYGDEIREIHQSI